MATPDISAKLPRTGPDKVPAVSHLVRNSPTPRGPLTPPPLAEPPQLIIPPTFGRPRTEAEHRYFRQLIQEGQALVDAAKARRAAGTTPMGARMLALAPKPAARPITGDPEPGLGGGATHREADGFLVNDPAVAPARPEGPAVAGLKAPVPHRRQLGGTCGLYALGMVMDAWHARDPRNPTALVQPEDRAPEGDEGHFNTPPTDPRMLLDVAREAGLTAKGELYQAEFVAETAARMGYQASLRTQATLEDVYAVLDAGHPAIVPFNVDMDGDAGTPDSGGRAHYAVLQGYFDRDGERYLVAKHSWRHSGDRVWRAEDFLASWSNLKTTKFYGTPGDGEIPGRPDLREPARLSLPDAGEGRADISSALARCLVEVVPPREPLTGGRRVAPR
jgi:hypothetical protein